MMLKMIQIGFKDVRLAFRDRAALTLMLLAPFLLTVGLGFVTGRFSGSSSSGLGDIPVVMVNQDNNQLGNALVDVFTSEDLADLLAPTLETDLALARKQVDEDQVAAVVFIPAGFTTSIIPDPAASQSAAEKVMIEVYANPSRPTSSGIVQTIVDEFVGRVEIARIGGEVAISRLLLTGIIAPDPTQIAELGSEIGQRMSDRVAEEVVLLKSTEAAEEETGFDVLAYLAPGMALMFLMFTVTYGGRSILLERNLGTLPRLLVSPTTTAEVLGGKVVGIFLTGVAQLVILIGGSGLLFSLNWGDPLGVAALILAAVFGASGWGMLLTALVRTPGQASSLGSALMLTFGILGGSFISLNNLPPAIRLVSRITPNAWGLDGFTTLALGGTLADLGEPLLALMVMGGVLFGAALVLFNRQTVVQR